MTIRRLTLTGSLLAALAVPAAANAYEAATSGAVNIRTGGGTNYSRITTLPAGTPVQVDHCRRGWCAVTAIGVEGWVSRNYIVRSDRGPVQPFYPTIIETPPPELNLELYPRRRGPHDYGYGYQHKPSRQFHPSSRAD